MTTTDIRHITEASAPPRPAWAKQQPARTTPRDYYWQSAALGPRAAQAYLMGSHTLTSRGWISDGPPLVMLDGADLTLAQATTLRDALTELLEAAESDGSA